MCGGKLPARPLSPKRRRIPSDTAHKPSSQSCRAQLKISLAVVGVFGLIGTCFAWSSFLVWSQRAEVMGSSHAQPVQSRIESSIVSCNASTPCHVPVSRSFWTQHDQDLAYSAPAGSMDVPRIVLGTLRLDEAGTAWSQTHFFGLSSPEVHLRTPKEYAEPELPATYKLQWWANDDYLKAPTYKLHWRIDGEPPPKTYKLEWWPHHDDLWHEVLEQQDYNA